MAQLADCIYLTCKSTVTNLRRWKCIHHRIICIGNAYDRAVVLSYWYCWQNLLLVSNTVDEQFSWISYQPLYGKGRSATAFVDGVGVLEGIVWFGNWGTCTHTQEIVTHKPLKLYYGLRVISSKNYWRLGLQKKDLAPSVKGRKGAISDTKQLAKENHF